MVAEKKEEEKGAVETSGVVKDGCKVKLDCVGMLDDGTVFDDPNKKEPIEFVVGKKNVIPGIENAVLGMGLNEEKEIMVDSKDAFGERRQDLLKKFSKKGLPKDTKLTVGSFITLKDDQGQVIPAVVTKIEEDDIIIDLNHPLAGRSLKFKLKVVGIE